MNIFFRAEVRGSLKYQRVVDVEQLRILCSSCARSSRHGTKHADDADSLPTRIGCGFVLNHIPHTFSLGVAVIITCSSTSLFVAVWLAKAVVRRVKISTALEASTEANECAVHGGCQGDGELCVARVTRERLKEPSPAHDWTYDI